MDSIHIPDKLINILRKSTSEYVYEFWLDDNTVVSYKKIIPLAKQQDSIMFAPFDACDGFIHNHIEDTDFSYVDLEFMLPELYYVLVTPSYIKVYRNSEMIPCN